MKNGRMLAVGTAEELKEKAPNTYRRIRKKFVGITASKSKLVCGFSKIGYTIARKIFKFN